MGKSIIVAGASGMVGKQVVELLIANDLYSVVYVLVRSKAAVQDNKVRELMVNYDTLSELPDADSLVICLGTTRKKAGSKEAFRKVDYDYVVKLAQIAMNKGIGKLLVVSSIGADATSSNFYLKTKGEMENALIAMNFNHLCIVRPSLLLGHRAEFRFGEMVAKWVQLLFTPFYIGFLKNYKPVHAKQVAKALLNYEQTIHESLKIVTSKQLHEKV